MAKIRGTDLCYTVGLLSSNAEYVFTVRAENTAGESADVAILESPAKTKAKASECTHIPMFLDFIKISILLPCNSLPCGTECYLRWLQHLVNVQERKDF